MRPRLYKDKGVVKVKKCHNDFNTEQWMYVIHDYLLLKGTHIPLAYTMTIAYEELYKYGLKGIARQFIKPSISFIKASLRKLAEIESVYAAAPTIFGSSSTYNISLMKYLIDAAAAAPTIFGHRECRFSKM